MDICYSYDVTQNPAFVSAAGAESPTANLSLGQGSASGCKNCFPPSPKPYQPLSAPGTHFHSIKELEDEQFVVH